MANRFVFAAVMLLVLVGCTEENNTIQPLVGPITESFYASGRVKASGQYQVYPAVTGQVLTLLVHEGDTVQAGQALLRIDDRTSSLGTKSAYAQLSLLERNVREDGPVLAQLRSAVAQAKDRLLVDSTNFIRQKALWARKIGSQNDLDQRELAYNTSRSAYDQARESLAQTRAKLRTDLDLARNTLAINTAGADDHTPRSLVEGIVYDIMIEPGELATTQKPLAIIGSATDLYLELEVDEFDIRQVKAGQKAFITLDSYEGQVFEAQVTRIIPYMDERSRTFRVEARFIDRPDILFPNLTVEASIVLQTKEKALVIPASYVIDGNFVLTDKDERTPIKVGLRDLQNVEVLDGIQADTELFKP